MDLQASADDALDHGERRGAPGAQPLTGVDVHLTLMHEVAAALGARPQLIEQSLAQVAALTVPRLADLTIMYLLRDRCDLERLAIVHRDPAKADLVRELQRRYPPDLSAPIGLAQVLRSGRSELAAEVEQRFEPLMVDEEQRKLVRAISPRSYLTVALQADGTVLGAIQLLVTESDRRYTATDLTAAELLASRCALALRGAQIQAELREARAIVLATAKRMERLGLLVEALNTTTAPEAVAHAVTEYGAQALGAHTAALALYARDRRTLELASTVGYPPGLVAGWRSFAPTAPMPLAEAARTGEPLWLPTLQARHERYPHLQAAQPLIEPGALACLPLIVEGQVIGVLALGFGIEQPFDTALRTLLLTLAHQCALALERARLYGAERDARHRAEAALAHRDRFLTAAAHELRTPLTALLGNAQLLRRRAADASERSPRELEMLDAVIGQAMRLSTLITNLLTVTELEAGQLILARAPVDLCALTRRVSADLGPAAERHTLSVETPAHSVLVLGDAPRLHAMLEALLRNALAYSPPGGQVRLHLRPGPGVVELAVVDHGRGIPAEAMSRIFERYYRAPNAVPASSGGLGINLWLAREMARLHGGDLLVESTVGTGSTFTVQLPLWVS